MFLLCFPRVTMSARAHLPSAGAAPCVHLADDRTHRPARRGGASERARGCGRSTSSPLRRSVRRFGTRTRPTNPGRGAHDLPPGSGPGPGPLKPRGERAGGERTTEPVGVAAGTHEPHLHAARSWPGRESTRADRRRRIGADGASRAAVPHHGSGCSTRCSQCGRAARAARGTGGRRTRRPGRAEHGHRQPASVLCGRRRLTWIDPAARHGRLEGVAGTGAQQGERVRCQRGHGGQPGELGVQRRARAGPRAEIRVPRRGHRHVLCHTGRHVNAPSAHLKPPRCSSPPARARRRGRRWSG